MVDDSGSGGVMAFRKSLFAAVFASLLTTAGAHSSEALAAGYAVFTQGASALGQGNAVAAHSDSPNAIFYNPALINKLDGTRLELGSTVIFSRHRFESAQPGGSQSSNDSTFFPSTVYLTHKFNETLSAGVGVFSPFGLGTEWGNDWDGRFLATKSTLQTFDFNPVLSYRVTPSLAVAAGLDVILLDATLERRLPPAALGTLAEVGAKFKGSGTGVGFNLAVAYELTKTISFGASYRSQVAVDITGDSSTSPGGTPLDSHGRTGVWLPQQLTAGIAYQVTDPLIVELGIRWEGWSSFKELQLTLDNNTPIPATARNWHDTVGLNLGGKYRLNDQVALLAGYIYGNSAVPDGTFDPSIPDADTHIFCLGTQLQYRRFEVALSYAYQLYLERTKNNSVDPALPPHYADGNYKSDAHLVALAVSYKF
jgi:long-chain fatty acid transport protein